MNVFDLILTQGIADALIKVVGIFPSQTQTAAHGVFVIRSLVLIVGFVFKQVDAGRQRTVEKVRFGKVDVIILRTFGNAQVKTKLLTFAHKVVFGYAGTNQSAVDGRIAEADIEITGRFFGYVYIDVRFVVVARRLGFNVHLAEIVQVFDIAAGSADFGGVESVAFADAELAADHFVIGSTVAVDVDAVDENAGAFLDAEVDRHFSGLHVPVKFRFNFDKSIAALAQFFGQGINALFNLCRIVPVTGFNVEIVRQSRRIHIGNFGSDVDFFDFVAHALFQHRSDHERLAVGTEFGHRRHHAEVGITVVVIEAAQQLLVIVAFLRIIIFRRRENPPPSGFLA